MEVLPGEEPGELEPEYQALLLTQFESSLAVDTITSETGPNWVKTVGTQLVLESASPKFDVFAGKLTGSSNGEVRAENILGANVSFGNYWRAEGWIRIPSFGTGTVRLELRFGNVDYFSVALSSSGVSANFVDSTGSGSSGATSGIGGAVTTGVWHHWAFQRGIRNTVDFLLDGIFRLEAGDGSSVQMFAGPYSSCSVRVMFSSGVGEIQLDSTQWIRIVNNSDLYRSPAVVPNAAFTGYVSGAKACWADLRAADCVSFWKFATAAGVYTHQNEIAGAPALVSPNSLGTTGSKATFEARSLAGVSLSTVRYASTTELDRYTFGTGDFAISFHTYFWYPGDGITFMELGYTDTAGQGGWRLTVDWQYRLLFVLSGNIVFQTPTGVAPQNVWMHIAVFRVSGVLYFAVNGAVVHSVACANNITNTGAAAFSVGCRVRSPISNANFDARMSHLAIWKGSSPFPAQLQEAAVFPKCSGNSAVNSGSYFQGSRLQVAAGILGKQVSAQTLQLASFVSRASAGFLRPPASNVFRAFGSRLLAKVGAPAPLNGVRWRLLSYDTSGPGNLGFNGGAAVNYALSYQTRVGFVRANVDNSSYLTITLETSGQYAGRVIAREWLAGAVVSLVDLAAWTLPEAAPFAYQLAASQFPGISQSSVIHASISLGSISVAGWTGQTELVGVRSGPVATVKSYNSQGLAELVFRYEFYQFPGNPVTEEQRRLYSGPTQFRGIIRLGLTFR